MALKLLLIVALVPAIAHAFFTIGYFSGANADRVLMTGKVPTFTAAPDAMHVADLVARLSGHPALLREESVNVPSIHAKSNDAIVLQLDGGALPRGAREVVRGSAFADAAKGPSADEVITVLKGHGIEMQHMRMSGAPEQAAAVSAWLQAQDRPVIILQHDTPAAHHYAHRFLATSNTTTPLSEFDISNYQICMWTGILMVILLLSAVCSIAGMEVVPDSLLYAKFQSTRAQKLD